MMKTSLPLPPTSLRAQIDPSPGGGLLRQFAPSVIYRILWWNPLRILNGWAGGAPWWKALRVVQ